MSKSTAVQLMEESCIETRTVTYEWDQELANELYLQCDDMSEVDGVADYWGTDEDGSEWSVRLVAGGPSAEVDA